MFKNKLSQAAGKSVDYDGLDEMEEWDDDEYGEEFSLDEEYEEESESSVEGQLLSSSRNEPSNKSFKSASLTAQPKRQKSRVSQKSRGAHQSRARASVKRSMGG